MLIFCYPLLTILHMVHVFTTLKNYVPGMHVLNDVLSNLKKMNFD